MRQCLFLLKHFCVLCKREIKWYIEFRLVTKVLLTFQLCRPENSKWFSWLELFLAILMLGITSYISYRHSRVEVWRWIFARNAVKCGEKKIIFTAYFLHLFAVNAVNRGELFIFTAFSVFLQKRIVPSRVRILTSCMPFAA